MIPILIRKLIFFVSVFFLIILFLELGIRITIPQKVDDIAFDDVYTLRDSKALNAKVKALVPGIKRTKGGFLVEINKDGNRDYDYTRNKKNGVTRIAVIGSSLAFGFNLKLEDTFSKKLEQKLERYPKQYEVLLFGRPGFKAKDVYAYLVDEVLSYDPDLVIYSFVQNNYESVSPEEFFNKRKSSNTTQIKNKKSFLSLLKNRWTKLKNNSVIKYIRSNLHAYLFTTKAISNILRELSPIERVKAQSIDVLDPSKMTFKNKIAHTESWIKLMQEKCKSEKIRFSILIHPYEMQLNKIGKSKWENKGMKVPGIALKLENYGAMKKFCYFNNVNFFNPINELRDKYVDFGIYIKDDYAHYNSIGNEVIAEFLKNQILSFSEEK